MHTSNNVRIFYNTNFKRNEINKDDTVLVFIYGLVCSNNQWAYQLPYFDNEKHKILIHDFRGHFSSSGKNDITSCTFKNMTQDLFELIQEINAKNVILISHSMGVNIALEFAYQHPSLVKGITLISGTVFSPCDLIMNTNLSDVIIPQLKKVNKLLPKAYNFLWRNAYLIPPLRSIVHHGGFHTKNVPKEYVTSYIKKIGELPPELFYQLMEEMKKHNIINHLEKIKTSVLIIGGDKDKIIPNKSQFALDQMLPNAELYIVKDGSHVPQADFPKLINERIKLFINQCSFESNL